MSSYRMDRTSEDIKRELTAILRTVKDPRVTGLVSIVRAEVSSDLSYAKIHISSMDGLEAAKTAVSAASSAGPCTCAMCPNSGSSPTIPLRTARISRRPFRIWKKRAGAPTGPETRRQASEGMRCGTGHLSRLEKTR